MEHADFLANFLDDGSSNINLTATAALNFSTFIECLPCSTQLEDRVGHALEQSQPKRRSLVTLAKETKIEAPRQQGSNSGKGKEEAREIESKRPLPEIDNEAQQADSANPEDVQQRDGCRQHANTKKNDGCTKGRVSLAPLS